MPPKGHPPPAFFKDSGAPPPHHGARLPVSPHPNSMIPVCIADVRVFFLVCQNHISTLVPRQISEAVALLLQYNAFELLGVQIKSKQRIVRVGILPEEK